ncbi:MAG TPA: tetratricopeptide repeat protein, partial [Chthonomonadales bacterium]|nr:tetratricopeptide repeat protein [Chthonomonadales bacterium]
EEPLAVKRRFRFSTPFLLSLLILDSAYLFVANRASGPPRVELSAFSYEGLLLLHLFLGIGSIGYVLLRLRAFREAMKTEARLLRLLRIVTALSFDVCLLSGLLFIGIGFRALPLSLRYVLLPVHDISTGLFMAAGLAFLLVKARSPLATLADRAHRLVALRVGVVFGVPFLALLLYTLYAPNTDRDIVNPPLPPLTAFGEGDGPTGKFFPASAQSVGGQFFPSKYFMDSASCGVKGCHPDIYREWLSSAHHRASFNNQWYRKAIEYMQEVVGTHSSKWCGGCHDMAVLLTEDPNHPGQSRFGVPIALHDYPADKYPESNAGIGCPVCHSIVHVKSTMGQNDYLADYPPMHKYLDTDNYLIHHLHTFLTLLAPEPHKKTFLRPFHTDATAKFCSVCHKVHLDIPVNGYRWFRGFDDYDAWQQSGVSGFGAASFYYPMDDKTGKPAFKKCADCHMPLTPSHDAGNIGGFIHSHRFPAANTALPFAYHDAKQMATVVKFLTDKALSIDIFALRRTTGRGGKRPVGSGAAGQRQVTPRASNLNGEINTANLPSAAANVSAAPESIAAPLNRGGPGAYFRRGESPLVDVVVRTLKLGHAFPAGTVDSFDIWVELIAKDDHGRTIYHSGKLDWKNGPVEEDAERYRALLVDGHSNPINKRNAWAARAVVYAKSIPPGAADVVHFRIPIPLSCGNRITLTAKLNYRKFNYWNNLFAYLGTTNAPGEASAYYPTGSAIPTAIGLGKYTGPVTRAWDDRPLYLNGQPSQASGLLKSVPVLPITVLAQNTVTLPVFGPAAHPIIPALPADPMKDRIRWNDYGIGLLLQGDFLHATSAFQQVARISPNWPEGYVNIGRVRQAERDSAAARAAFKKAFQLYAAHHTPMTPYQLARTQFFYAQTLFDLGRLDDSLNMLRQVMQVFPQDRNVRNTAGMILFRLGRYNEAIAQFQHTLSIDPEDITAHYNMMKCYRATGDLSNATIHEKLYHRFKADETTQNLVGAYELKHPYDNSLAQPIHEHSNAVILSEAAWLKENGIVAPQGGPAGELASAVLPPLRSDAAGKPHTEKVAGLQRRRRGQLNVAARYRSRARRAAAHPAIRTASRRFRHARNATVPIRLASSIR